MPRLLLALFIVFASCGGGTKIVAPPDVAQPPVDAIATESGLVYVVLKQGSGPKPKIRDEVTVHYSGWKTDGVMFDSSVARGKPKQFAVNEVIAGWTEALQLMNAGSTYRIWVPEPLAYGGKAGFPDGTLVFDVQLISVD